MEGCRDIVIKVCWDWRYGLALWMGVMDGSCISCKLDSNHVRHGGDILGDSLEVSGAFSG